MIHFNNSHMDVEILLKYVKDNNEASTLNFSDIYNLNHQEVIGTLKSLEASERLISRDQHLNRLELTDEGKHFLQHGSHEYRLFLSIPNEGLIKDDLKQDESSKIGLAKAMANKWICLKEVDGVKYLCKNLSDVEDTVALNLKNLENLAGGDGKLLKDYKKRKLVKEVTVTYYIMSRGPNFDEPIENLLTDISEDLLKANPDLTDVKFKKYNVCGGFVMKHNLHLLNQMKKEYARILVNMGFREMPTNKFVESSFWNFDALFQPQEHSARDAHDTFFLTSPSSSDQLPHEYVNRVKQVHSHGGYGSQGYNNPWKIEEAQKNIMRTHTTAVSARMLYLLAQKEVFEPVRYFSIDRVFRNESLDATHLAEFHQVEGLIADRGITLASLMSVIRDFFKQLGIHRIRFKAAYNPYTEPSMEIFGFHDGLNKWIEIGNSGVFRPEMLLPMGLPEDVNVIAWGLSLERPTMIKSGLNDIRKLIGPKMDMRTVWRCSL